MTNKEKFEVIRQITVQDIIDWLDGCAITYKYTEKNLNSINGQYCSKETFATVFSKEKYGRMFLSNGWWLDNSKPFLEEFSKKKNEYWDMLSKNSVRKCDSVDDIIRMIVRSMSPYLHFRIDGRSYDYINIKSIVSRNGSSVYLHDKSNEIKAVRMEISETRKRMQELEAKLRKLEEYQKMHENLGNSAEEILYTEGKHYL